MIPQFRLTEPAIRDIEQIADYIAKVAGLVQSERFLSKLEIKFAKIAQSISQSRTKTRRSSTGVTQPHNR